MAIVSNLNAHDQFSHFVHRGSIGANQGETVSP